MDVGAILKFCNEVFFLEFSQNMQKFNKIGFKNSIPILRVVITKNSTLVDKFLNLPSFALPSYTITMHELAQTLRVMPKIFIPPHTPS